MEKAPEIANELNADLDAGAVDAEVVDEFETRFTAFAVAFQTTVEAFARSRQQEVERKTLPTVSEYLAQVATEDAATGDDSPRS